MPLNVLTENDFQPKTLEDITTRFRRKIPLARGTFDALVADQKKLAFSVGQVHNTQLVQAVRDLLAKAIEDGTSFAEFRAKVLQLFSGKGVPSAALGRLQLAFRQNAQQTYNDARRTALDDPEVVAAFPFRRYSTVGNGVPGTNRVRADHAILHGKVFRWNDPFWNTFTPPWDYGCRCTMMALTAGQVRRGRMTVWTLKGGSIVPVIARKGKQKPFRIKTNPKYAPGSLTFGVKNLDADLKQLVKELSK